MKEVEEKKDVIDIGMVWYGLLGFACFPRKGHTSCDNSNSSRTGHSKLTPYKFRVKFKFSKYVRHISAQTLPGEGVKQSPP